jgi:hypothetical protein
MDNVTRDSGIDEKLWGIEELVWVGIIFLSCTCLRTKKLIVWGNSCGWKEVRLNFLLGTPNEKLLVLHIHHFVGDFGDWWPKMGDYAGGNKLFLSKLVLKKNPYGQW